MAAQSGKKYQTLSSVSKDVDRIEDKLDKIENGYVYRETESFEMSKGEVIGLGAVGVVVATLFGWLIWSDVKNQQELEEKIQRDQEERQRREKETRDWKDSERAKGNVTLRLANGDLISVSSDAYQNATIRPAKDL